MRELLASERAAFFHPGSMPTEPTPPAPTFSPRSANFGWSVVQAWPRWLRMLLPLLAALVVGVAFQGSRGLTETSETRYAECAREMLVLGDWMQPSLEFQPHWTKPPVAYWCVAAGMKVFGVNAWGARLPGVVALLVGVWAVLLVGRRLWGDRVGFAAAVSFALGFPAIGAYMVTTDIYLAAAETVAGAAFIFAATEAEAQRRRWYARAMWAAWGLGFMIKGPPVLLPLLAFIPWNLLQPRERRVPLGDLIGLLGFMVISFAWFLAMIGMNPELFGYWFGTEIVGRVSTNLGHNRAWYKALEIYGPGMLAVAGPFGLWAAVVAWRGGWNRAERWRELWTARDVRLALVGWVVLPLIVFCLSRSKLHLYVLPLAAPVALVAGRVLAQRVTWRHFRTVTAVVLVVLVVVKGVAGLLPSPRDMATLGREVHTEMLALPADAPVVLWDEATNHGVTFYLGIDRKEALPERIAVEAKGKFEKDFWSVEEFRQRLAAGSYPRGALLVVLGEKRAELDAALPQLPVVAERKERFWHFLRLGSAGSTAPVPVTSGSAGG